jgi:hypothetical protein
MSQKNNKIIEENLKGKELNHCWQFTKWSLKYQFIEDIFKLYANNTTKGEWCEYRLPNLLQNQLCLLSTS